MSCLRSKKKKWSSKKYGFEWVSPGIWLRFLRWNQWRNIWSKSLFFLHSTSTPFSQQIDGAISKIRSSLKYTRLEDIEQVSSHQNQVAADNMHFTNSLIQMLITAKLLLITSNLLMVMLIWTKLILRVWKRFGLHLRYCTQDRHKMLDIWEVQLYKRGQTHWNS